MSHLRYFFTSHCDTFMYNDDEIAALTRFEESLYGENPCFEMRDIVDVDFWVNRIVTLPSLRPFLLDETVSLCEKYCNIPLFREEFTKNSVYDCPVLVHRLFKRGVLSFQEIEAFFCQKYLFMIYYYFRNEIKDFPSFIKHYQVPIYIEETFLKLEDEFDLMMEYGFSPSSIEYCLKYDDVSSLHKFLISAKHEEELRWSPFEWSNKPSSLDYLSFSGYFGSVSCFKQLLLNGYSISDSVRSNVVCGGNTDLFHICFAEISNLNRFLFDATKYCRLPLIGFLEEKGCDLNSRIEDGETLLYYASINSHLSIIRYLVMKNADVNEPTFYLYTPLQISAMRGLLCIVDFLVSKGAKINEKDWNNTISLHDACQGNRFKVVKYLVENGSLLDVVNIDLLTPIALAAKEGHLQIVEYLADHKANIDFLNLEKKTPLFYAAINGHIDVVKFLASRCMSINEEDAYGMTPIDYAREAGHNEIVAFLESQMNDYSS